MPVTAQEIMEEVRAAYASCASYRDRGNVRTDFLRPSGELYMSTDRPFLTVFQRPDRFRYEYRDDDTCRRYVVWREGVAVRSRWDMMRAEQREESLVLALAGATGVSGGSAHTVPSLLLPDEFEGNTVRQFVDVELVGEVTLDGVRCHHLTAAATHDSIDLWTAIDACLIRRIQRRFARGTFATASVTDYHPSVGINLGDDEFRFDGPGIAVVN